MRNIIIYDDNETRKQLLPLTYTRPIAKIRIGITTIEEKWQSMLGEARYSWLTASYLQEKFPLSAEKTNLMIAGHVLPSPPLAEQALSLREGEAILDGEQVIAFNGKPEDFDNRNFTKVFAPTERPVCINKLYDIFEANSKAITLDFNRITKGRASQPIPNTATVIGDASLIFIEKGACVDGAFLNTKNGPIYVGENAEIMECACVRGPFAACNDAKVKISAKIYEGTTLGPFCKVGGEVENTVFIGYSNKAHDGFIGDAVVGEWCNLGGGTTASNLKNDYGEIKLWNYAVQRFERTGRQFVGLVMGDHCKTGVNCMINTATVLGVGVNIHGSGFPRNFVASFMEGSSNAGFKDVNLKAFFTVAERVMSRRGVALTEADRRMYDNIYAIAKRYK